MGEPKIVVVDYHKGNLSSVVRGLARAGAAACTSDDPEQIHNADGLVIPGVGAFYDAIAFMRQSGEADAVLGAVVAGTPLLGICLGLQLFFERGNEGVPADEGVAADGGTPEQAGGPWVDGLGIMRGSCTRLESTLQHRSDHAAPACRSHGNVSGCQAVPDRPAQLEKACERA